MLTKLGGGGGGRIDPKIAAFCFPSNWPVYLIRITLSESPLLESSYTYNPTSYEENAWNVKKNITRKVGVFRKQLPSFSSLRYYHSERWTLYHRKIRLLLQNYQSALPLARKSTQSVVPTYSLLSSGPNWCYLCTYKLLLSNWDPQLLRTYSFANPSTWLGQCWFWNRFFFPAVNKIFVILTVREQTNALFLH